MITSVYNKIVHRFRSLKQQFATPQSKFQKRSYSQSGEDLIIDFIFNQLNIFKPSYIDIGAHHPFYLSNTALFYEKGCNGINIEPDPELFKQFSIYRKKDININCGVNDEPGEMTLNIMNVSTMNTFSGDEASRLVSEYQFQIVNKAIIPVQTVQAIIEQYNKGVFPDLLSIDVEGFDEVIIKSIDFNKSAPKVICIETIGYSENGTGKKDYNITNYLKTQGYMVYADTNINTIFVMEKIWQRNYN